MALSEHLVNKIFIRMTLRYGAVWLDTLVGADGEDTKAEWARELTGTSAMAIEGALDSLPDGAPPSLAQFKSLCVFAPGGASRAARRQDGNPRAAAEALARMADTKVRVEAGQPRLKWAHDLRARERAGEKLSNATRRNWRAALGLPDDSPP